MENGRVFNYKGKTLVQVAQGDCTCWNCIVSQNKELQNLCKQCGSTVRKDGEDVMYLDFLEFVDKSIGVLNTLAELYPQKTLENVLVQLKAVKKEYGKGGGKDISDEDIEDDNSKVDLGLPSGLLWATCNVGATSPEHAGRYFAWGEKRGNTNNELKELYQPFNWASYNMGNIASISSDLTLEWDAAYVNLGGKWRMPTKDEYQELIDNCVVIWTENYYGKGVNGWTFKSKINKKSVFFPAAGYCNNSTASSIGTYGRYWSASCYDEGDALCFNFNSMKVYMYHQPRYYGFPVRGVCER